MRSHAPSPVRNAGSGPSGPQNRRPQRAVSARHRTPGGAFRRDPSQLVAIPCTWRGRLPAGFSHVLRDRIRMANGKGPSPPSASQLGRSAGRHQRLTAFAWIRTDPAVSDPRRAATHRSYDRIAAAYRNRFEYKLDDKPFDRSSLDAIAAVTSGRGWVVDLGCGPGQIGAYLARRGR